ncbi:nucleotidyltransferase domain-containing protein [Kribbella sp. NPDC051952]|uniref:nucleotidyltransferase domain-containing protein n=1 Tax=Kribbella sp. NPDC051952 TaxID=3154851 RepID=UPI00341B4D8C
MSTEVKRQQVKQFIERRLLQHDAVKAVVVIGSVAAGTAHVGSDIDVAIFLEPYDDYLVPAEAIWRQDDDTFHSIFSDVEGIQLDFHRYDLQRWRTAEWSEPMRAELAAGWVAFDRDGEVTRLIAERSTYDDEHRIAQLDEAITWLDQHLDERDVEQRWETLDPLVAHDRLQAAYGYLVQGLFAANRRWRIWRNREMTALLALPWLPNGLEYAAIADGHSKAAYLKRATALRDLFGQLQAHLQADGTYGTDPIGEAFIRSHDEPGRAWNLDHWNEENQTRHPNS